MIYFLNRRDYQQDLQITPLRDTDPVEDHQITVCIRKRPMNKKGTYKLAE
jgi:kinesin family protein 2/24